jgi:hypothetical protein
MNVLVRSKRGSSIRRRREGFRGASSDEPLAPAPAPTPAAVPPAPATLPTSPPPAEPGLPPAARQKVKPPAATSAGSEVSRERGTCSGRPLTNDEAVYSCQCGFVFEAPVSTSVGCPHCGGTQAW